MLRRRWWPLWGLLLTQAISVTGNRIALIAIPWFVLETTGSAGRTGLVAAANTLPVLLTGVLAGPLIDRVGLRRTSVLADLASGATLAAIPLLHTRGALDYGGLLALVFLGAVFDAPGETARRALLPAAAEHAGSSIDRATSLHETMFRLTQLLGGPLAGLLIATVGAAQALLVDAATFALSAVLVASLTRVALSQPVTAPTAGRYRTQVREAIIFIWRVPLLRSLTGIFVGANVLEQALFALLLPAYANQVLDDPVALGLMVGATGVGALTGVAGYAALGHRSSRRALLLPAFALAGAPKFLLLATFPPTAIAVAGIALAAVAAGPVNPIAGAVEYDLIPAHLRARVFGLLGAAFVGSTALGTVTAGLLVELVGLRPTLLVAAAFYALLTAVPFIHPAWRNPDLTS